MDYLFKNLKKLFLVIIFVILLVSFIIYFTQLQEYAKEETVKVGVLFSETGVMSTMEKPTMRAALLAIEQINSKGLLPGTHIIPVVYDGKSNWRHFAKLATKMIEEDHVVAIFGCITSACRKAVKSVVEKHDNVLIYPASYEGVESSDNVVYLGLAPNQHLVPAVSWLMLHGGKKVYFVGSDYIWPRVSNVIMEYEIKKWGGEMIASEYKPLGSLDVNRLVDDVVAKKPDCVISMLVGPTAVAFLDRLYDKIPKANRPAIVSFGMTNFDKKERNKFTGLYFIQAYNKQWDGPENIAFLSAYRQKYGSDKEVEDPAVTVYTGVYLWAQAVLEAPSINPEVVRQYMLGQSRASPLGPIFIDTISAHTWRSVYIERINERGESEFVWSSRAPLEPVVYPDFKSKSEWSFFEYQLFVNWGYAWEKS